MQKALRAILYGKGDDGFIDKMDTLLGRYYAMMGNHDYFNGYKGSGRLRVRADYPAWLKSEDDDDDDDIDIMEEFELNDFPINLSKEQNKEKEIYEILTLFYNLSINPEILSTERELTWSNILEIVYLEFDQKISQTLKAIIEQQKNNDIETKESDNDNIYNKYKPQWIKEKEKEKKEKEIEKAIHSLQKKENLDQDQMEWLLFVIQKFKKNIYIQRKIKYRSNDIEIERMYEVFGVHKIFINEQNKTSEYNLSDFYQDLKINNNELNQQQIEEFVSISFCNPTIDIPAFYVINDDIECCMNYVFGATYLLNNIISNHKEKNIQNLNIIIIPKKVQSSIDPNNYYKYHHLEKLDKIQNKYKKLKSYKEIPEISDDEIFNKQSDGTMTIIVDRRMENDEVRVYMVYHELFDEIMADYSLSFSFMMNTESISSYLYWGRYQRGLVLFCCSLYFVLFSLFIFSPFCIINDFERYSKDF